MCKIANTTSKRCLLPASNHLIECSICFKDISIKYRFAPLHLPFSLWSKRQLYVHVPSMLWRVPPTQYSIEIRVKYITIRTILLETSRKPLSCCQTIRGITFQNYSPWLSSYHLTQFCKFLYKIFKNLQKSKTVEQLTTVQYVLCTVLHRVNECKNSKG